MMMMVSEAQDIIASSKSYHCRAAIGSRLVSSGSTCQRMSNVQKPFLPLLLVCLLATDFVLCQLSLASANIMSLCIELR